MRSNGFKIRNPLFFGILYGHSSDKSELNIRHAQENAHKSILNFGRKEIRDENHKFVIVVCK